MIRKMLVCSALCLAMVGCGEKAKEMKDAMEAAKNLSQHADEMQSKVNDVQKLRDERKAKGDTLAMPYQKLEEYLPASINGYKAENPSGESMNVPGMSYSTAKRHFSGDNGNEVDVEIFDYNQSVGTYEGLTALWALGMSVDNDHEFSKTFDPKLPYSAGFEHYYKQEKRSELILALGGRFLINVKANNQPGNDLCKNIANSMKLSELATK